MSEYIQPKRPTSGNWDRLTDMPPTKGMISGERYLNDAGIRVITAVEVVPGPLGDVRPEFHISLTDNGERIPSAAIAPLLAQFGATGWDEDNHVPGGKARHYWCRVGGEPEICPCKDNEKPTDEGDYIVREE